MNRNVVRKRVMIEILRMEYPSELLTLCDLFGEQALKGPRCGRPTALAPVLELSENDNCNFIIP